MTSLFAHTFCLILINEKDTLMTSKRNSPCEKAMKKKKKKKRNAFRSMNSVQRVMPNLWFLQVLFLTFNLFLFQLRGSNHFNQWRSQGLPGWVSRPARGPKWRRKCAKFVEKKKEKLIAIWGKNEESETLAHPGLWGWLRPWLQYILIVSQKKWEEN